MAVREVLGIGFIQVLSLGFIEVLSLSFIELATVEITPVKRVAIRMVAAIETIGMHSPDVATMPRRISHKRVVVVDHCAAGPITSPRVPSPTACQGSQSDSSTERNRARRRYICGGVT